MKARIHDCPMEWNRDYEPACPKELRLWNTDATAYLKVPAEYEADVKSFLRFSDRWCRAIIPMEHDPRGWMSKSVGPPKLLIVNYQARTRP